MNFVIAVQSHRAAAPQGDNEQLFLVLTNTAGVLEDLRKWRVLTDRSGCVGAELSLVENQHVGQCQRVAGVGYGRRSVQNSLHTGGATAPEKSLHRGYWQFELSHSNSGGSKISGFNLGGSMYQKLGTEKPWPKLEDVGRLAITADERWVYVLRRRGVIQRFLIAQPGESRAKQDGRGKGKKGKKRRGKGRVEPQAAAAEAQPPRLPEAQQARLGKLASCMSLLVDEGKRSLALGGPRAEGTLGRLWTVDPESLEWEELRLSQRELAEPPPPPDPDAEPPPPQKPSFIATKNKLSGAKISTLSVDDIVGSRVPYWVTHGSGSLLERPTARLERESLLPGDALLLPAMVRFSEGTARPALLVWPGVVEDHKSPPGPPQLLVWGDEPRGWMSLETPQIRKQKWSRTDVFPIQVAIAQVPEGLPGKRVELDSKWVDKAHFEALAKECKKLLKVLW